jgi:precorrin-8X/cobalt-precorrin-8 methylmutase
VEGAYNIVIAGHGSRDPQGVAEFESFMSLLKSRAADMRVDYGYLEFCEPTIDQAVHDSIASGTKKLVMVPALLTAATHAKNDMPAELMAMRQKYPDVEIAFGSAMDLHPLLLKLCQERIVEAEAQSTRIVNRGETCLVVVGRGTSDSDANSEISKLSRMLEEGMGFGTSFVCYAGTAKPLIANGLKAAAKLGYARIIVLPYFLFDGILIKRIYDAVDDLAHRHPEIEVLKAKYLGVHEYVADVFLERAQEGAQGRAHMNCSLCKYRVQIVGFESQQGQPQQGHHFAVKASADQSPRVGDKVETKRRFTPYTPHPIEAQSFEVIKHGRDWSKFEPELVPVLQRIVHTTGDFDAVDGIFFSPGVVDIGVNALLRCRQIVTDVTMVESGLKRALLSELGISTWCGVHGSETHLMSENFGITRSAAGIRRAWQIFGNNAVIAIGDAPTAINETIRLVREQSWRPQLVIGLPVGFIGTQESKNELRRCMQIPRITNEGTRGGSPWAATVLNALMIVALNKVAASEPV